jgi:hypothetical protein
VRVWKHRLSVGEQEIHLPKGARILTAQRQDEELTLWALVNPTAPPEVRRIQVVGTGWDLDSSSWVWIATVQAESFVWHVFEVQ